MTSSSCSASQQSDHSGESTKEREVLFDGSSAAGKKRAREYAVDKNIPVPAEMSWDRNGGSSKHCIRYPFSKMDVTDSFFIAGGDHTHERYTIKSNVLAYARRHGVKFATRSVEENGVRGLRIWRIA
jgi:hypothetical protein